MANTKLKATRRLPMDVSRTTALMANAREQETEAVSMRVNM